MLGRLVPFIYLVIVISAASHRNSTSFVRSCTYLCVHDNVVPMGEGCIHFIGKKRIFFVEIQFFC